MRRWLAGLALLACVGSAAAVNLINSNNGATGAVGPTGATGATGPTLTGTDTDVCFVNGSNAVCTDNGIQWHTTTKRLALTDGGRNTMIGDGTGFAPDLGGGGLDNVLIGHLAGSGIDTAARTVVVGSGAAPLLGDQDENVVIGSGAGADMTNVNGEVIIGTHAGGGAHTESAPGTQTDGSVIIGTMAGSTTGDDISNVIIGGGALNSLNSGGNTDGGSSNVIVGDNAAHSAAKLQGTVILGKGAARVANLGLMHDIAIGEAALENAPGGASDQGNIAIGYRALRNEDSSENGSIAIGETALQSQTDGGQNVGIGDNALSGNVHGFNNAAVGFGSGANVGADANTLVGYGTNVLNGTIHDGTAVGQNAKANANGAVAIGSETTCASADTVCLGSRTLDMNSQKIVNVTNPTTPQGAATKAYVDAHAPVCDLVGVPTCSAGCASIGANSGNCVGSLATSALATSAVLTFSGARSQTPSCTCTDSSVASFCAVTAVSASSVTFGLSATLTGTIYYRCELGR